ncbi:MAG TPA: hypothetical protein VFW29_03395, partial [Solirubrobacteraceae bacterium]|nr:hypothetical protein [Solirubrobacteraceae bacterium]
SGHLSTAPVEGFTAPVKFKVAANGKQLEDFTYGSFGCFGAGGFRPGVNPYKGNSLVKLGALKVAGNGRFAQTKTAGYTVQGQTTSFTVSVSGHFTKHTRATGTIKFTESNSVTPSKCTSDTLTFTASS